MFQKKSLGQNFLHSPQIISDIIEASFISPNDVVVEIGPGRGVLTEALLKTGAKVISIEKDSRLIGELSEKFASETKSGTLNLIEGDILDFNLNSLPEDYKVVANIPYYITGQIFRMFFETQNQPKSITVLIQKEVADRVVTKDGKESLLSLSVKAYGIPKYVRTVGRGAFSPPPNVDSAVLYIDKISRKNFQGLDEKLFFQTLHAGFAHKRKQLLPNLSSTANKEKLKKVFEKLGINTKARAEDISLDMWLNLSKKLQRE